MSIVFSLFLEKYLVESFHHVFDSDRFLPVSSYVPMDSPPFFRSLETFPSLFLFFDSG